MTGRMWLVARLLVGFSLVARLLVGFSPRQLVQLHIRMARSEPSKLRLLCYLFMAKLLKIDCCCFLF